MLPFTKKAAVFLSLLSMINGHVVAVREHSSSVVARTFEGNITLKGRQLPPHSGCCNCGEFTIPDTTTGLQADITALQNHGGSCEITSGGATLMVCNGVQGNRAGVWIASPTGDYASTSCALAAEYAQSILGSCSNAATEEVQGQICDPDGFCIIVASNGCN